MRLAVLVVDDDRAQRRVAQRKWGKNKGGEGGRGEWGMCEEGEGEDNFYRVGFSSQGHWSCEESGHQQETA